MSGATRAGHGLRAHPLARRTGAKRTRHARGAAGRCGQGHDASRGQGTGMADRHSSGSGEGHSGSALVGRRPVRFDPRRRRAA
ncbi:unannotated protein [freshwater metagenome]|uniref:Unannotated protein n=1 Tax=freshwater metagenome TaxID=449393 RepID=A0A6J6USU0_9ZZZZ